MDELFQAMSVEDIGKFRDTYKDNPSVVKILDGYIEAKMKELAKAKAKAEFVTTLESLVSTLPHPEDIANIYMAWREVEVEDKEHPEQVEVVKVNPDTGKPIAGKGGKPVMETVTRYPKSKVTKWVVELNKGFSVKGNGGNSPASTTTKRAITVHKVTMDKAPELVGNFRSASDACKHLKLEIGADSAMRVLTQRNPYITQAYAGSDFTS